MAQNPAGMTPPVTLDPRTMLFGAMNARDAEQRELRSICERIRQNRWLELPGQPMGSALVVPETLLPRALSYDPDQSGGEFKRAYIDFSSGRYYLSDYSFSSHVKIFTLANAREQKFVVVGMGLGANSVVPTQALLRDVSGGGLFVASIETLSLTGLRCSLHTR